MLSTAKWVLNVLQTSFGSYLLTEARKSQVTHGNATVKLPAPINHSEGDEQEQVEAS